MTKTIKRTKPPITAPPLRAPGQSLQERYDTILNDTVLKWIMMAVFAWVMAGLDYWFWLIKAPRHPGAMAVAATIVTTLGIWRVGRQIPKLKAIHQGMEGERVVGQFLEEIRQQGYAVLHDIVIKRSDGQAFNVDHVLVGPAGVFACETKTRTKPASGEAVIHHDGLSVTLDNDPPDIEPVRQAKASATAIRAILSDRTGHTAIPVRPVLLYPGWFVKKARGCTREVWVLNPQMLPAYLDHEESCLSETDAALYTSRLAAYVREMQKAK